MFNGKMKAFTLSYDDGVVQDIRFIELLDKYGLKCTFNLNSGLGYKANRIDSDKVREIYKNHEVAVHTITHPWLDRISNEESQLMCQIEGDKLNWEKILGYKVVGMAYPYGTGATNDKVIDAVKKSGVMYSRGTNSTLSFEPQENLYCFEPTIHHGDWNNLFRLAKEFIELKPDSPKIFYVWGHTYEFDRDGDHWDKMEEFLKLISGHDDIFYGTNTEVLLGYDNKKEKI